VLAQEPGGQIAQLAPLHARSVEPGHSPGAGGSSGGPRAGVAAVTRITSSKKKRPGIVPSPLERSAGCLLSDRLVQAPGLSVEDVRLTVAAGSFARVIPLNLVLPLLHTCPLTPTSTTTLSPISTSVVPGTHVLVMLMADVTWPTHGAVVISVTV